MNKKSLLFLIPVMALVLAGCGKRGPDDPTTGDPSSDTSAQPTTGTTGGSVTTGVKLMEAAKLSQSPVFLLQKICIKH